MIVALEYFGSACFVNKCLITTINLTFQAKKSASVISYSAKKITTTSALIFSLYVNFCVNYDAKKVLRDCIGVIGNLKKGVLAKTRFWAKKNSSLVQSYKPFHFAITNFER
jgi:hypothetical protein